MNPDHVEGQGQDNLITFDRINKQPVRYGFLLRKFFQGRVYTFEPGAAYHVREILKLDPRIKAYALDFFEVYEGTLCAQVLLKAEHYYESEEVEPLKDYLPYLRWCYTRKDLDGTECGLVTILNAPSTGLVFIKWLTSTASRSHITIIGRQKGRRTALS